jgi:hypothetical protein
MRGVLLLAVLIVGFAAAPRATAGVSIRRVAPVPAIHAPAIAGHRFQYADLDDVPYFNPSWPWDYDYDYDYDFGPQTYGYNGNPEWNQYGWAPYTAPGYYPGWGVYNPGWGYPAWRGYRHGWERGHRGEHDHNWDRH